MHADTMVTFCYLWNYLQPKKAVTQITMRNSSRPHDPCVGSAPRLTDPLVNGRSDVSQTDEVDGAGREDHLSVYAAIATGERIRWSGGFWQEYIYTDYSSYAVGHWSNRTYV